MGDEHQKDLRAAQIIRQFAKRLRKLGDGVVPERWQQRAAAEFSAIPLNAFLKVHAHSAYAARGIAWWSAMTERQRLEALRAADTACPAEAWAYWRATGGFKCEEVAHG